MTILQRQFHILQITASCTSGPHITHTSPIPLPSYTLIDFFHRPILLFEYVPQLLYHFRLSADDLLLCSQSLLLGLDGLRIGGDDIFV